MVPKISVIIPIYNDAPHLARCCKSLFEQSFLSLEFVFVDDCSTDGSLQIVRNTLALYPHRQHQVVLLSLESHKGVGAARQLGLENASGEYVIHCDSDDWIEPSMYDELYKKACSTKADIVTCGFFVDTSDGETLKKVHALLVDTNNLPFSISPQTGSIWSKLVRRQFIVDNNLRIPDDIMWGEDLCFSLPSLLLSKKTERIDKPLYHYVQQKKSLTHDISPALCTDLLKCGEKVESFLIERELLSLYEFQLNWLKFQLKQYLLIFPETRDIYKWSNMYPECHSSLRKYSAPFYLKIISWLIIHRMLYIANALLLLKDAWFCRRRA